MLISIREFALTANFGPVRKGMSSAEVKRHLGEPGGSGQFGPGMTGFIYGWYEIFFFDDRLMSIQNDHVDFADPDAVQYVNDRFRIDPWILDGRYGQTMDEIRRFFAEASIEHEAIDRGAYSELKLRSEVSFESCQKEDGDTLAAIRYWPKDF